MTRDSNQIRRDLPDFTCPQIDSIVEQKNEAVVLVQKASDIIEDLDLEDLRQANDTLRTLAGEALDALENAEAEISTLEQKLEEASDD